MGTHRTALFVAGGANYPESPPWLGGRKQWHDDVYVLQKQPDGAYTWLTAPHLKLPGPLAYGASLSTEHGLVCIGGANADSIYADVFLLRWHPEKQQINIEAWPPLPRPSAYHAAARVGDVLYVAGGQETPRDPTSTHHFFALDLSKLGTEDFRWQTLPPWPGPPRIGATAVGQSDGTGLQFYLFGGRQVRGPLDAVGLHDAYSFNPRTGRWRRLADLTVAGQPRSVLGAPGLAVGTAHVLVFGGADGRLTARANELERAIRRLQPGSERRPGAPAVLDSLRHLQVDLYTSHPGFSRDVLAYHTITNTWSVVDRLPESPPITTTAVWWDGSVVLPTGEIRPGVRTAQVWQGEPLPPAGLSRLNTAVIALYFLVLLGLGVRFSRREKTTRDYFLAGRRVPWWAAGLSLFGTSLSAITFMAVPAKTYATDWLYFTGSLTQVLAAPLVIALFLPWFRKLNVTTAYEFLEKRFGLGVRLLGSVSFVLFQLGRIGIVLFLPAIALSVVTGLEVWLCIVLVAGFSIAYTVLGGIEAVIWTDVLQVGVLLGGALLSLLLILLHVPDGVTGLLQQAAADQKLRLFDFRFDLTAPTFWVVVVGGLATFVTSQGSDQTMVQRYLTTRDQKNAARGLWTHGLMAIPSGLLFFGLGTALYVFFKTHPAALNPLLDNADAIFPWFIVSQLPNGVSGLLIAGVFAASMSSLDSSLNSVATVVTSDFYRRFRSRASERHYLGVARAVTLVTGLLGLGSALLLASLNIQSLWDAFFQVIGLFTGGLGGLFLLGVMSKRPTAAAAVVGFLGSGLVQVWLSQSQTVHFLLYTFTGMASCVILGLALSLVFPKR